MNVTAECRVAPVSALSAKEDTRHAPIEGIANQGTKTDGNHEGYRARSLQERNPFSSEGLAPGSGSQAVNRYG